MLKIIIKQFYHHWKVWLAILPIFIVSGTIFSTSLVLLEAFGSADVGSQTDYGVFLQMPIVIGGVVLCLLTNNAMRQCIDFFDETNDILLLLGASPLQLSLLMTGQMLLTGLLGAAMGITFSLPVAHSFLKLLPTTDTSASLQNLPVIFSGKVTYVVVLLQVIMIVFTCMRYCLKNYKRQKGALSASLKGPKKNNGSFVGIVTLMIILVGTVLLFLKEVPDPTSISVYTNSMKNSMNLLLLLWLSVIISMNFLMRPLFRGGVRMIVKIPSMAKRPMLRSAFHDLRFHEESIIKLMRPVSVITLLIGNFIALFLNTKLLVDGGNGSSVIYDLVVSLIFVFGAPMIISLANIITSISLFKLKTGGESDRYFFSGCTPRWTLELKLMEIGAASLISIVITFLGTFLFAIPLLRVAFLGGGNIFDANWSVNVVLTLGVFGLFFLVFTIIYWWEGSNRRTYVNE